MVSDVLCSSCFYLCSGGDGKPGGILSIRGWEQESGRSVANVTWATGLTNVYRVGHKGKVDLKYTKDASGGFYYKDHLPKLGMNQVCHKFVRKCNKSVRTLIKCVELKREEK